LLNNSGYIDEQKYKKIIPIICLKIIKKVKNVMFFFYFVNYNLKKENSLDVKQQRRASRFYYRHTTNKIA